MQLRVDHYCREMQGMEIENFTQSYWESRQDIGKNTIYWNLAVNHR